MISQRIVRTGEIGQAFRHAEGLAGDGEAPRRPRAIDQLGQHLLAARIDEAQRAEIVFVSRGRVQQRDQQRRTDSEKSPLLPFDRLEHRVRVGRRAHGNAPAGGERRQHSRRSERKIVRRRKRDHEHGVRIPAQDARAFPGIAEVIDMRPRDQFRNARRSPRQQHERHLERIGPIGRQHARHVAHPRLLLDPGTQIRDSALSPVSGRQQVLQCRSRRLDFLGHRDVIEISEPLRKKIGLGAGELGEIGQLAATMVRQAHDRYDADLLQSKEDDDEFTDVRKLQENDIARLQTEIEQAQRHTSGEPVHIAVAEPSRCIRDEGAVGEGAGARFQ